jgi:hypothetical protein
MKSVSTLCGQNAGFLMLNQAFSLCWLHSKYLSRVGLYINGVFAVISKQQESLSTECQREKTEIEKSRYEKFEELFFFCGGIKFFQYYPVSKSAI